MCKLRAACMALQLALDPPKTGPLIRRWIVFLSHLVHTDSKSYEYVTAALLNHKMRHQSIAVSVLLLLLLLRALCSVPSIGL